LGGGNHGTNLAPFPSRRAIEINLEQLISLTRHTNEVFPGPGPFWLGPGLRITKLKTAKALGLKFRQSYSRSPDEGIVVLSAAVHMPLHFQEQRTLDRIGRFLDPGGRPRRPASAVWPSIATPL
jgi:hypothetical protein